MSRVSRLFEMLGVLRARRRPVPVSRQISNNEFAIIDLRSHPDYDQHEMVIYCNDEQTGLRAFVAIHSTLLGPGMGGCRMKNYPDETSALGDALRLSRGMSFKYAASGHDYGGAKAVIIDDGKGASRSAKLELSQPLSNASRATTRRLRMLGSAPRT